MTTVNVTDGVLTDTAVAKTLTATHGNSTGNIVLATFTDADPWASLAELSASVNWGGTLTGTPTVFLRLVSRSATLSTWQVIGSATYANAGTFAVTVTISDVDGSTLQSKKTTFTVT
jgi:hypothetical protein